MAGGDVQDGNADAGEYAAPNEAGGAETTTVVVAAAAAAVQSTGKEEEAARTGQPRLPSVAPVVN